MVSQLFLEKQLWFFTDFNVFQTDYEMTYLYVILYELGLRNAEFMRGESWLSKSF